MTELNKEETAKISGGVGQEGMAYREPPQKFDAAGLPNPVSGMSFEDAMKKAEELGPIRRDMGGWSRMSGADFLKWWASSNAEAYEAHKSEVDAITGAIK